MTSLLLKCNSNSVSSGDVRNESYTNHRDLDISNFVTRYKTLKIGDDDFKVESQDDGHLNVVNEKVSFLSPL